MSICIFIYVTKVPNKALAAPKVDQISDLIFKLEDMRPIDLSEAFPIAHNQSLFSLSEPTLGLAEYTFCKKVVIMVHFYIRNLNPRLF